MKNLLFLSFITLSLVYSCSKKQHTEPAQWVNPFIGTAAHGHTYPGASLPFGMVQLSPDTRLTGWDGCSGYHYSDSIIYGFTHTHLSGTGCSDYGDILLMPSAKKLLFNNGENGKNGYRSGFSKDQESSRAGWYHVYLNDNQVDVELTCTKRVGFHKYRFANTGITNIILDLYHRDALLNSSIRQITNTRFEGYRQSAAWARNQQLYFAIEFSKPVRDISYFSDTTAYNFPDGHKGKGNKAIFTFDNAPDNEILVKVALSAVSTEGAWKNMKAELQDWDFDQVKKHAYEQWNKELGKIDVSGKNEDQKTVFYTALYHSLLVPNLYMDVDGSYLGRDFKIHKADGFNYYTTFSLWDTYRAEHPLLTIIDTKRTLDFIKTFVNQYIDVGELPVWEFASNETYCMIGYHSIPVIADAYLKGINKFDTLKAFEAMLASANKDVDNLNAYRQYGYIPAQLASQSVSRTLEYAYDDWCIAQMAQKMNKTEDYEQFIKRAQSYKNLYDKNSGFMRARMQGNWYSPFDPREVNNHYTEANSWQYSFYVPQDINTLIDLAGGAQKFIEKLDALFSETSETTGREQSDITGLIGQYAHGNEPSHHIAYLYSYAGAPSKTQFYTHKILNELYTNSTDGLCGNEDCGQMSAWYVLSAMGFYPVCPGSGEYVIGNPMFDDVKIHLENGNTFEIKCKNNEPENIYIKSAYLNDEELNKAFITHKQIMQGGVLVFEKTNQPGQWKVAKAGLPNQKIENHDMICTPVINSQGHIIYDTLEVRIEPVIDGNLFYGIFSPDQNLDELKKITSIKKLESYSEIKAYKQPFKITAECQIIAWNIKNGLLSKPVIASYSKAPYKREITLNTEYANQYTGGGKNALVDGIHGTPIWQLGFWQGYEGKNLDAVLHFDKAQKISTLKIGFLSDPNAWIFYPEKVEVFVSRDGKNFKPAGMIEIAEEESMERVQIKEASIKIKPQYVKSFRLVAYSIGECPANHPGAGKPAWLFSDEITWQ